MISVSIAELHRMGRELIRVADHLGSGASVRSDALEPDGVVSQALDSVERDWSTQRHVITAYLRALGAATTGAADAYQQLENEREPGRRDIGMTPTLPAPARRTSPARC